MAVLIENCKVWGTRFMSVYSRGGVVAAVSKDPTQAVPADTLRIDGRGGTLLPGLADTHCHPFGVGLLKRSVDLRGVGNVTGLRLRLFAAVQKAKAGEWVVGRGWDHEAFAERRLPDRADVDDLSKDNPVALTRVCGHISLLNSRAIAELGLEGRQGEEYDRDGSGRLTGIVREGAHEDVLNRLPAKTVEMCRSDLLSAEFEAAKFGLTTLHSVLSQDSFKEEIGALFALERDGHLSLSYRAYVPAEALDYVAEEGLAGKSSEHVRVNGVKIYADGSLGAGTAALREPYSDDPSNSGLLRYEDEGISDLVEKADSAGHQVIIHAIGDRAVEQAIAALSPVTGSGNPRRHRVEHASLLPRDLIAKMRKHGIRATVQPCFVVSDTWAAKRLGEERVRDLYPFRSMMDAGIVVSGSSDAPVETLSPVIGMWAAMTRGEQVPEECLTLPQAVQLYTKNAWDNGLERGGEGLEEGARADFTLLDSDIEGMHAAMLRKVGVAATVVGGNVAYSFEGS